MTILLDTHALLWWQAGGDRLSPGAARAIRDAEGIFVSPLSCWEITTLQRQGKIELDREPLTWVQALLRTPGVEVAGLSPTAAAWAGALDSNRFPGDPIDRMLYATAMDLRIPLVTKDERLTAFARAEGTVDIVW
ncbi:MAG: type II toxin-antitoxin system VapC family toxin [Chloroflexota bacterium]